MHLSVANLTLRFHGADQNTITNVTFKAEDGEFIALLGPSGCGKTTTLNIIASLVTKKEAEITGKIEIDNRDYNSDRSWRRRFGYVFQRPALLPWNTIVENVSLGLAIRQVPLKERIAVARDNLARVNLLNFADHYPYQLSGGMQQRAALARTLIYDPDLIFMDEPFGALDAQTRLHLQAELIGIWAANRKTILFVTHDLTEAITLAERILIFTKHPGRLAREITVPFPHPRDPVELRARKDFADFELHLWNLIQEDFR